jgi:hypothetical protein
MSPLVNYACPPSAPTAGETHDLDFCAYACKAQCLPTVVLARIWELNQINPHRGDLISPTSLKACPRKLILTRLTDYSDTPPHLYWSTRGSLYHGFLESDLPDVYSECRIWKGIDLPCCDPFILSGAIDTYEVRKEKLSDIKTLADKGLVFLFKEGVKPEYIAQTNVYRYLMDGGHLQQGPEQNDRDPEIRWPVKEIQIHHLLMSEVVSSGTTFIHREFAFKEPNYGKPYAMEVSRRQEGKTKKGCPIWELTIRIPPIPVWPTEQVEQYIVENAPALVRGFREPTWMPPAPPLTDESRAWECGFCPIKATCDRYEEQQRLAALNEVPQVSEELMF